MKTDLIKQDTKIDCPHCKSKNCFQEDYEHSEEPISAFLCLKCGFTSSTLNVDGSPFVEQAEASMPALFKAIRFVDDATKLVWYPMVLNFPSLGIVFPDGVSADNWKWRAVPMVSIPEEERENYKKPEVDGVDGGYYDTKADMAASVAFKQDNFYDACKLLKIIVE